MNRRAWLCALLAGTLLATWWAAGLDEAGAAAAPAAPQMARDATRQATRAPQATEATLLAQLRRTDGNRERMPPLAHDPFAATNFQPPPPPQPADAVAAKPAAPPLPFQFQGLLRQDGKLAVVLVDGPQLWIAREGETIAGQYRVEQLTTSAMVVQSLPQGERQTLNFGR